MSFADVSARRAVSRSLCAPEAAGPLSPFFKEVTFRAAACHPTAAARTAAVVAAQDVSLGLLVARRMCH